MLRQIFARLTVIGLVLVLLDAGAKSQNTKSKNDTTFYKITIAETAPKTIKVEANFALHDNVLYMEKFGAEQFPKRWAQFVQNVAAVDSRGKRLKVEELSDARWKINAPPNNRVRLSYEVALKHEESKWAGGIDGVAFSRDWGIFLTGRTWLILNGNKQKDVRIEFLLPRQWRVTASWETLLGQANIFRARNFYDLSESMFFAGTHEEFAVKNQNFELIFALGGAEISRQKDAYKNLAQSVLDYYINLMGGIPRPPPNRKFSRSLVIINAGEETDGEVIGNHISLILDPNGERQSQILSKFIFAHEFFHLWNGKSINVADTTEDWFKEGLTNYYALKALRRSEAISDEEYFSTLSDLFYRRYASDSGLGKSSMRDVASGADKDEHWGLIYGGGLFVGVCQDVELRRRTENRRSINDLMKNLFKIYGGTNKKYTTVDLEKSLTKLSGTNQTEFFKNYVFGTKQIPIEKCLSEAGLNASIEKGELKITRKTQLSELEESILNGIIR